MSTISATGAQSTNLLSLFKLLQQKQNRLNVSNPVAGKATDADGDNDGLKVGQTSDAGSTTAASGVSPTDLKSQIDAAVSAAIKNQPSSGSVMDLLQSIRAAVDDTLKQNGIDPQTFEQQLAAETNSNSSAASTTTSTAASNQPTMTSLLASLFPQPSLNVTA